VLQPLARLVGRIEYGLAPWRRLRMRRASIALPRRHELAMWDEEWRPPEDRLSDVAAALRRTGLAMRSGGAFDQWDVEVRGGICGGARVLFAAEDHGAGRQYVRFRITPRYSRAVVFVAIVLLGLATAAALGGAWIAAALVGAIAAALLVWSMLECGVASAAARGCVPDVENRDRSTAGVLLAHRATDGDRALLDGSRAPRTP
jgi:hypothetical protein